MQIQVNFILKASICEKQIKWCIKFYDLIAFVWIVWQNVIISIYFGKWQANWDAIRSHSKNVYGATNHEKKNMNEFSLWLWFDARKSDNLKKWINGKKRKKSKREKKRYRFLFFFFFKASSPRFFHDVFFFARAAKLHFIIHAKHCNVSQRTIQERIFHKT